MSNYIYLQNSLNLDHGVGTLDFEVAFRSPKVFERSRQVTAQIVSLTLSDRIPNIFNATAITGYSNDIIRVNTNIMAPIFFTLPRGLYGNVETIADAILYGMKFLDWWSNPDDPGFAMYANTITDTVVITLDSTKLKPAVGNQLTVDISRATTKAGLGETLGFSDAIAHMVSPVSGKIEFNSDIQVRLDTQGTKAYISVDFLSGASLNGITTDIICVVGFEGKNTISDNVWPPGGVVSPNIPYTGDEIRSARVKIRTEDKKKMVFMNGSIFIWIKFEDVGPRY